MKTHVGISPFLPVGRMIPQRCPFCSFLHAFLGPPLHCSPKLSLPQRHRKPCIVCPATKGNAKTPEWPSLTPHPQALGEPGVLRLPKKLHHLRSPGLATFPSSFLRRACRGATGPASPGLEESQEGPRQWKRVVPVRRADGRDCSVPCVTVLLKDYLSMCHRGNGVGAGRGQDGRGSPIYIKGATSL